MRCGVYRDRLYLTTATLPCVGEPREWSVATGADLDLGCGLGTLQWSRQIGGLDAELLPDTLCVRQRRGGETLKAHRRGRTQSLQHLCQSAGVLPWMRDALPLVYAGTELIAVGDLWQDARWLRRGGGGGLRVPLERRAPFDLSGQARADGAVREAVGLAVREAMGLAVREAVGLAVREAILSRVV